MENYKQLNEYLNETIKDMARTIEDKNREIVHLQNHLEVQASLITELKQQLASLKEFKL